MIKPVYIGLLIFTASIIAVPAFSQDKDAFHSSDTLSPYLLSWKTDGIIGGTALGLRLLGEFLPEKELELTEDIAGSFTSTDVVWFDRLSIDKFKPDLINFSTTLNYFAFIAPLPLLADRKMRNDFLAIATMFVETRLLTEAMPMITKKLFPRFRPYVYSNKFDFETKDKYNDSRSFFSNQSAYVFSSAVFSAKVFSDFYPESKARPWIWGSALTTATAIGVLRHEIGIHYISDLVVGAAIGSALGYFIPHFHLRKSVAHRELSLAPTIYEGLPGMRLTYRM
jgi:membrane-associated phospholipid phosphatase